MRKQLLSVYRRYVPARLKRLVPKRLKAFGLNILFRLTRYPDLRFWQVAHLHELGLTQTQKAKFQDPLFDCSLATPTERHSQSLDPTAGSFFAEFGFLGLKIQGWVNSGQTDDDTIRPDSVAIKLDGQTLRSEHLRFMQPSHSASFQFTIRRSALWMFPKISKLSVQDSLGRQLVLDRKYYALPSVHQSADELEVHIPHGNGTIFETTAPGGGLDKKGWPPANLQEIAGRQREMLRLYSELKGVFDKEFDRPLFILYGTLLGQHRSGGFIPNDDDFDIGYVSQMTSTAKIKSEAIAIMERLVELGYTIVLNHLGRPHRIRERDARVEIELDNHVLFALDAGHTWLHPRARLNLPLTDFVGVERGLLEGIEVFKPADTEGFLREHYGENWRVPDGTYANIMHSSDKEVRKTLSAICLTKSEQRSLQKRVQQRGLEGEFIATALEDPYPIDRYAKRVGF